MSVAARKLPKNALFSSLQVLYTGLSLFVVYRWLLDTGGKGHVGLWGIILSTASVSRISELGLTGSVVKFVAKHAARGDRRAAGECLSTATWALGGGFLLLITALHPVFLWLLPRFVPAAELQTAAAILPWALVSVWLASVGGCIVSGLDGLGHIDLRSKIMMLGVTVNVALSYRWIEQHGIHGLAWAQAAQGGFVATAGIISARLKLESFRPLRNGFSLPRFKEMFHYGLHFQAVAISTMLFEPTTKLLLSRFGGLELTGLFEMATRLVTQVRALLVAANRAVVPVVANLRETDPKALETLYRRAYDLISYSGLAVYGGLLAAAPLIGWLWLGRWEPQFLHCVWLVTIGWFINTLAAPAYFANLGTGELRWNTITHVGMGIGNALLGFVCGQLFGGHAVIIACVSVHVAGSLTLILTHQRELHLPWHSFAPRHHLGLGAMVALTWLGSVGLHELQRTRGALQLAAALIALILLAIGSWRHPLRAELMHRALRRSHPAS